MRSIDFWFGLGLFFLSFLLRFYAYQQSSFANGWDSYFYLVQVKSFMEEGQMHSSRVSLFYPLLITVQWFVQDYELTYVLVSTANVALFSVLFFRVSKSLSSENSHTYYLLGLLTLISPQLTYFGAQYVKNLLGINAFILLVMAIKSSKYWYGAFWFFINALIHKLTLGLSLLFTLGVLITQRLSHKFVLSLLFGSLILISALFFLPQVISLDDFSREGFGLTMRPQWPSISLYKTLHGEMTGLWVGELVIANASVAFLLISLLIKSKNEDTPIWFSFFLLLLALTFPFLQWSVLGLAFRAIMVFVLIGPLGLNSMSIQASKPVLIGISAMMILVSCFSIRQYNPNKSDPPYNLYKNISEKVDALSNDKEIELIIGHKAMAEYITFKTGIDVLPWQPEYDIAKEKLWRIVFGMSEKTFRYYSQQPTDAGSIVPLSPNYLFVREELWALAIHNMEKEDPDLKDELMSWRNPTTIRPDYLLKKD